MILSDGICNDGSKFMSLLWHISVFVFSFQYFTQPFPKDVALSFITFAHLQKKFPWLLQTYGPRQPHGCKAKHYSPSAFTIITSYLSQCLGQHCLFWEAEKGIVDDGNLSCFSELNKNIQLHFTSLLSAECQAWSSQHSCKCYSIEMEQKWLYGDKGTGTGLGKFFQLWFETTHWYNSFSC